MEEIEPKNGPEIYLELNYNHRYNIDASRDNNHLTGMYPVSGTCKVYSSVESFIRKRGRTVQGKQRTVLFFKLTVQLIQRTTMVNILNGGL